MQVSEVRLNLLNSNTAVKAIGSFALDDSFAVRGVRVMEDKHGHNFVAFPSREKQDGSYEDILIQYLSLSFRLKKMGTRLLLL